MVTLLFKKRNVGITSNIFKLHEKAISCNFMRLSSSEMDNETLRKALKCGGPELLELAIITCPRISDAGLSDLFQVCSFLQRLVLQHTTGINGSFLHFAGRSGQPTSPSSPPSNSSHHKFSFRSVLNKHTVQPQNSPRTVPLLQLKHLVHLDLSGCRSLVPMNLFPLKDIFPCLKAFAIGKCFLTDDDAALLLSSLPDTTTDIDISFNPVSEKAVKALCSPSLCTQIQSLSLSACRLIPSSSFANSDRSAFSQILTSIELLSHIDFSQCSQIAENEFFELDGTCNLISMDLSHCPKVTRTTLDHLRKLGCRKTLRTLKTSGTAVKGDDILEWFKNQ